MKTIDRIHETTGLASTIDDAIGWADRLRRAGRACCCTAAPCVVAVLPPSETRDESTDLLLCGHHYRQSAVALAAVHAKIYDRSGQRLILRPGGAPGFPRPS